MSAASAPGSWRPDQVRRRDFTVRFRGLDPNEVRGFLNALADDLAELYQQITTLMEDNGRLRGELQRAQDNPQGPVTDQAVLLLNQAQQLADALIDEGMESARDLLLAARSQQRDIFQPSEVDQNPGAEDLARLHEQITALTEDNSRLRGELQRAQANPQGEVTDQAVLLLNQAQQLADALIDEGMQSARDLLLAARSQQRDIIHPSSEADHGTVIQAIATADHVVRHDASPSDVDDARMFARVPEVQFRAVLDALNEQVNRLGQFSEAAEHARQADDPEWSPPARQRRAELNPRTT